MGDGIGNKKRKEDWRRMDRWRIEGGKRFKRRNGIRIEIKGKGGDENSKKKMGYLKI